MAASTNLAIRPVACSNHGPDVRVALNKLGHSEFRPGQFEAANAVLNGRDVVVKMATSGGKSMCYLLASMCLEKLVLLVSPLISLMEDQV